MKIQVDVVRSESRAKPNKGFSFPAIEVFGRIKIVGGSSSHGEYLFKGKRVAMPSGDIRPISDGLTEFYSQFSRFFRSHFGFGTTPSTASFEISGIDPKAKFITVLYHGKRHKFSSGEEGKFKRFMEMLISPDGLNTRDEKIKRRMSIKKEKNRIAKDVKQMVSYLEHNKFEQISAPRGSDYILYHIDLPDDYYVNIFLNEETSEWAARMSLYADTHPFAEGVGSGTLLQYIIGLKDHNYVITGKIK